MQKAAENSRPMSGGKGGKRISVFDRLGPGNDEAPPPTHRRYSSEKHSDKGRHLHPHVRGEDPPRERKPSHQDFEDKKHLHYRDVPTHPSAPLPPPPLPPPPTSRPRHRHFHGTPESEYSEEEAGRRPAPRKPRETQEAVVMGEGYPPKLRLPPDDRGSKVARGGGVRVKRRGGEGGVGRSSSESSLESEVGSGEEGKRRRSSHHREPEKRPRHSLESGKLSEEGSRRLPEEGGRRLPEEGGRRLLEEGGRRLPEEGGRRLPEEGGRRLLEEGGRRLPEEGSRRLPEEGGRRLPEEGSRRLPEEGGRRLPEEGGRRLPEEGSRRLPEEGGRRLPEEGGRRLPEEGGRRLSKHLERKEKGNERHTHLERVSSGTLPPPSGIGGSELKGLKLAGEGKEEREGLVHHKRRREEEYLEPRHLERKRKREHVEDDFLPPPEAKKSRTSLGDHMSLKEPERQRSREGEEKHGGRMREVEGGERKRRYEGREPPTRKHPHMQSPGMAGRRHSRPPVTSPGGGGGKRGEHHYRKERKAEGGEPYDSLSETDSVGDEVAAVVPRKKLDWSSLSTLTLAAKPRKVSTSAVERFTPGVLLAQVGTSPLLAGPELYRKVSGVVSDHLRGVQQSGSSEMLSESVVENPFGFAESARAGISHLELHQELSHVFTDIGPCRRALTASVDFAMRRKLRKNNSRDFLPSSHPSTNWDSEHYATSLSLYQSLGTKASGKPAFRLHHSRVGTVLIAR